MYHVLFIVKKCNAFSRIYSMNTFEYQKHVEVSERRPSFL